jgi:uncharacterized protein (TIGR03382 family)
MTTDGLATYVVLAVLVGLAMRVRRRVAVECLSRGH